MRIADLNLKGIYRIDQVHRFYPRRELGSHVIGFLKDEQGLAGVEFYYDSILRGGGVYDPRLAAAGIDRETVEGVDGVNLVLTIDIEVQDLLERKLKGLMAGLGAKAAMAVLMAPNTGEIIASASLPAYDPNRFWELSTEERKNRVVEDLVDLGGVRRFFMTAATAGLKASQGKAVAGSGSEVGPATEEPEASAPVRWWAPIQDGVYVSPEGLFFGQLPVGDQEFAGLARNIGLIGRAEVDLPDTFLSLKALSYLARGKVAEISPGESADSSRRTGLGPDPARASAATPLAVLSAFCRIINGGREMTPHVLGALWPNGAGSATPVRPRTYGFVLRPEQSAAMLATIKDLSGPGKDAFVIESLIKQVPVLVSQAAPVAGTPENPEGGAAASAEQPAGAAPQAQAGPANSILLAMGPVSHPEVALIVVLEDGQFDPQGKSPVREIAEGILLQARLALRKQQTMPSGSERAAREFSYYRQWEKGQRVLERQPLLAHEGQGGAMPDLAGLSLRKAMQVLQQHGLRLQVVGSGQVVRQSPAAGSSLAGVDRCVLHLKAMQ